MPQLNLNRTITQIAVNQSAAGSTDIVAAPGSDMLIYVVAVVLSNSHTAAGTLKFTEGTGPTDLTGELQLATAGGIVLIGDGMNPILQTKTVNSKLSIVTVTGFVDGYIRYFLDR